MIAGTSPSASPRFLRLQHCSVRALRAAVLASALACPVAAFAESKGPVPEAEQVGTVDLQSGPHVEMIYDWVEEHAKDGRAYLVDGDTASLLGVVPAAFYANVVRDPAGKSIYVAETIWTRGNRGDRQDLLTVYDAKTLQITREIKLPGRALITTKKQDADASATGKYVYVFNMDPADTMMVVDPAAGKVVASVDIAGCALAFPFGDAGFSSICGDGSLATVALDDPAQPKVTHSAPFFDPDKDPVFEQSPTDAKTGMTYFLTYDGIVHPTKLGPTPDFQPTWSILEAAGEPADTATPPAKEAWRLGGWQVAALHKSDGHLYALMHKGPYWTHKSDGTDVWEIDVASHKLIKKIHLEVASQMVDVSQDDKPLLYSVGDDGKLAIYDAVSGAHLRDITKLGDNPVMGYAAP